MDSEMTHTQYFAIFLIVFGMCSIGYAEHYGFRDMIIAAVGVVGGGTGLITGQSKQASTKQGDINVSPTVGA